MVWDVSFTCDVCGKKKGEANHWWMLAMGDCPCDEADQVPQRFTVMPWRGQLSQDPEMRHLCGQGCAMQALERYMTRETAVPVLMESDGDLTAAEASFRESQAVGQA